MSSDKPISPNTKITVTYTNIEQACATLNALCVLLENYKDLKPVTQSKGVFADYANELSDALNSATSALLELIRESIVSLRAGGETFRLADERLAKQSIGFGSWQYR